MSNKTKEQLTQMSNGKSKISQRKGASITGQSIPEFGSERKKLNLNALVQTPASVGGGPPPSTATRPTKGGSGHGLRPAALGPNGQGGGQGFPGHGGGPSVVDSPATKKLRSAATWTVVVDGAAVSYCTRSRWRNQARPERGDDLEGVPPPFRGLTLAERDDQPQPAFSEKERRALCATCRTLVVSWDAHRIGALHLERTARKERVARAAAAGAAGLGWSAPYGLTAAFEEAAVRVLMATRPDLLTAAERGLVSGEPLECAATQGLAGGRPALVAPPIGAPDPAPQEPAGTQRGGRAAVRGPSGGGH
ncbi:hypothetical protein HPB48_020042 [Haemaphysalis longicornis]|uniref:Uncharacterized protein n=1 Tax=Haemaphysalis longicornis TaxID=44386 RepID=A0A9J6GXS3_HAELO|nr:hypothetical protein HPB48_020042 [Haemaphysalis longicornis]